MSVVFSPYPEKPLRSHSSKRKVAFTLIELLVVMAIIGIMIALAIPAVTALKGAGDVTKSAYDISGILENARTYAIANNTYVWVGFYEEDGSQASTVPATSTKGGRVVISIVASKDGTRYSDSALDATNPPAFGTEAPTASPLRNQVKLVQLNKLTKLDNMHLAAANDGLKTGANTPPRPPVQTAYQVGDSGVTPSNNGGSFAKHSTFANPSTVNPTTFTYPLAVYGTTTTTQYTFTKIIEFNAQGEASKIDENTYSGPGLQDAIEIALQPANGGAVPTAYSSSPTKTAAAVQVEGLTGRVQMFRP